VNGISQDMENTKQKLNAEKKMECDGKAQMRLCGDCLHLDFNALYSILAI